MGLKLADLNPLHAAHEIAKLRHVLQLQKAGHAVGAVGGAAASARRETALTVGKTLSRLLNSAVTGPILMRFLRGNPDLCVTLLDLLLQPLVPVISFTVGKVLIGMVQKPEEKEGGFKLVRMFPPTWEKAGEAKPKPPSRGMSVPGGAAFMKGVRGGGAGAKKAKKPPKLLSFRKSKTYGASSDTVDAPSGATTPSDEEMAEPALEGIDEKTAVATPRGEKSGGATPRGEKSGGATPRGEKSGPSTPRGTKSGDATPRGESDMGEEAVAAASTAEAEAGKEEAGKEEAGKEEKKKEALITVQFIQRLNVQYSDLSPSRVVPELAVGLSSLGVMKAVGAVGHAGMNVGKGVVFAPGKGMKALGGSKKGKKTFEDGFEAGFVAAQHTGPSFGESFKNCINATPGLNKCVPTPKSAEEEEAIAKENEKKLKIEVEKEWPIGWRDIKQHIIRMTVNVNLKLSLGQLDLSVGGKKWLGKILSGFKLDEGQVAQLRLDRVAIQMRVRIFWYAKQEQMKIMVLKRPLPKLVDLTHELTLCSKLKVPPGLIRGAIEKLVLPMITGKYFDVDLKPPPKKKGGKKGEVDVPEDATLPMRTSQEDPDKKDDLEADLELQTA